MSDYRRMVSYIYSYDEGIKNKNVGFARVESRNGQCKILVNLKGVNSGSGNEQQVYFFRKEEDRLVGIYLGSFWIKNGTGEFREITNVDNIKNSGYGLSSIGGVLIRSAGEFQKIFASGWDDGILKVDNFILDNEEMSAIEAVETTEMEYIEEEKVEEEKVEEEKVEEEIHVEAVEKHTQSPWEKLCDNYTKVQVFEEEPNIICLKINLKDIERLPKKNWPLVNNSFLLHGYYSYRYLILANLDPMQSKEYILGIPGIFHPNEKFVAAMFGFEFFKAVKKSNSMTGQFGYWYTKVKEN